MANSTSKIVVTEFSITFGGTAYDAKSINGGVTAACEPPDVTVGTDVEKRATAAGYTEDGDITATLSAAPAINTTGALVLKRKISAAGATATTSDVSCGTAIVTAVTPSNIEAGGDRVQWFDVTFKPTGDRT